MNDRIRKVILAVLVRVRAAHKYKILLVLDCPIQNRPAILQSLSQESVCVVSGCRNSNNQLVRVGFHGLLEQIVLLRSAEGVYLVTNSKITVQRILRIRICRKCPEKKRSIRKCRFHRMLVVIVDNMDMPAVFVIFTHPSDVIVEKVERFQRLNERRSGYVHLCSRPPIPQRQRPRKSRRKRGLAILSRNVNQCLMEPYYLRSLMKKSEQIVNNKYLPRLK